MNTPSFGTAIVSLKLNFCVPGFWLTANPLYGGWEKGKIGTSRLKRAFSARSNSTTQVALMLMPIHLLQVNRTLPEGTTR
jgi:hypothetical protein